MVRYPPAILAPPGVARLQACVMTISPALTSSVRAGAANKDVARMTKANMREIVVIVPMTVLSKCAGRLPAINEYLSWFRSSGLLLEPFLDVRHLGGSFDGRNITFAGNQNSA